MCFIILYSGTVSSQYYIADLFKEETRLVYGFSSHEHQFCTELVLGLIVSWGQEGEVEEEEEGEALVSSGVKCILIWPA